MQSDQASHLDQSVCWDSLSGWLYQLQLDNGAGGCWHSYFSCHKTAPLLLAWWVSLFFCKPELLRSPVLCAYLGWGTQEIHSLKLLILWHTVRALPDPDVCPFSFCAIKWPQSSSDLVLPGFQQYSQHQQKLSCLLPFSLCGLAQILGFFPISFKTESATQDILQTIFCPQYMLQMCWYHLKKILFA